MATTNHQCVRQIPFTTQTSSDSARRALTSLFCFSLALSFIANAYHVFTFPLTIDGEVFAFTDHPSGFLSNKRWAAEILAWLLVPRSTIPIIPDLLAISASAAAYTLTAITWRSEVGLEHYVAAPFALAFPIFFEVMLFPSFSYGVFIGFLLSSLGMWFIVRGTLTSYTLSVICVCLAVGVYQPVAIFSLSSQVVMAALDVKRRGTWNALLGLLVGGALILLSILISQLIGTAIICWYGLSSNYVGNFFRPDLLFQAPRKVMNETVALGIGLLSGRGGTFIEACTPYEVFLALVLFWGLVSAFVARNKAHALFSTLLLVSGVAGSIGVAAINGGSLPLRTLLGLPIALTGLAFAAAGEWDFNLRWSQAARWSLVAGSAWCFLSFATIGSRIYYSAYVTWLNDRALGEEIINRIDALPSLDRSKSIYVEVSGYHIWPRSQMVPALGGNPAGSSFFGWDEGIAERIVDFMKTLGQLSFQIASREQHETILSAVANLPSWPSPGSISSIGNIVIIKFGPYSNGQR